MLNIIVEYLRANFQPDSIILHGSRARGRERPHSDWDFILLYKSPTTHKNGRLLIEDQNVEYYLVSLPVVNIFSTFDTKLNKAILIFDTDDVGSKLLTIAAEYYNQGVHWDKEKQNSHKLWIDGRVDGMRDNTENPFIFQKYYGDFYGRVFNYWYWLVANQHSEPIYIALDEIRELDPVYFKLVTEFADSLNEPQQKVLIAESIVSLLFKK